MSVLATLAALVPAQNFDLLAPGVEGNSSTSYPWNRGSSAMRIQYLYDSTAVTSIGLPSTVQITAIKFRANGNAAHVAGS